MSHATYCSLKRVPPMARRPQPFIGSLLASLALLCAAPAMAAVNSGSTGADGEFNPTVNTEVVLPPSGVLNYTTVNIPLGVTVKFKRNATNTPVYMLATGDVVIAGTIDIRGGTAPSVGTQGDGVLADDGNPGIGGPGGYDGGRGGRDDVALTLSIIRGGAGLGPGGGRGARDGGSGCDGLGGYVHSIGAGGAYSLSVQPIYATHYWGAQCSDIPLEFYSNAYGSSLLLPLMGGSGGGGGLGGSSFAGSGGGGGGGAILIASSTSINLTGVILAHGGAAGGVGGTNAGETGAGGAGGAIRLVATSISGSGGLYADGGCVNQDNNPGRWCGINGYYTEHRGGSPGRIRIEAEAYTFTGSVSPAAVVDTPGPLFISAAPSLRISQVADQTVPASPTGTADVVLPASATGPVTVTFATTNVPVGNIITLRVVPAYGALTEVISPAIAGSAAAGTTQVSVTLPSGPSTLQATTSYTVVVAGTLDLSRFAQNEAVDKVEVTVAMVGEPQARLITASGKSYVVPYAALRAAGFKG